MASENSGNGTEGDFLGSLLTRYPKRRPPLSKSLEAIYETHYASNRNGRTPASSLSQAMESWLHKKVAEDVHCMQGSKTTLEIGAGTLNQIDYESEIGPYDIVEPFKSLYDGSVMLRRIRSIFERVDQIPLVETYDRITSVATLEHICDLPDVIARCGILLNEGGELRAAVPSEGTPLWKLGWMCTTGLEFRLRYGLDYGELMRHEHVNTADEIERILVMFFSKVTSGVFGLNKRWSLYRFYGCRKPRRDLCVEWLRRRGLSSVG